MAQDGRTFSESWHRVADLRVSLRPAVTIRKQLFRGKPWYVLQDPFNNQFFRLRPEAHDFIIRLRTDRSIAEVWDECIQRNPSGAPGQDDVIQLLSQLHYANLLFCELPADSSKLFERYNQRKQRETKSKYLSLMFLRIPLFDPESLLRHCKPVVQLLTGRIAFALWLMLLLLAGKTVIEQLDIVVRETRTLLDFDNLLLLYLGLFIVKTLHEFGHTLVCKRFGGEVHTMGVMLILFAPLPYMDATSSWSFRSRRQRILVASAGMFFEFFAASCAALVWANTGPGTLHSLSLNMMIVASVSTLAFNINPLLRYDGYYILSDLLDIPNLQPRAIDQLKHLSVTYLFGDTQSTSCASSPTEAFWLSFYGIFSAIYRVFIYGGIILFIADRFLLAGLAMAAYCLFTWGTLPIFRFIAFLSASPKLVRNRMRAITVSLSLLLLILLFLATVPFPKRFSAPGVVESSTYLRVANHAPGQVVKFLVKNGVKVQAGTVLVQLSNPEFAIQKRALLAQKAEVTALLQQSSILQGDSARQMLERRQLTLDSKLDKLLNQQADLLVKAEQSGVWISPKSHEFAGRWLPRGAELGKIVSADKFKFIAVVSQAEAANLFNGKTRGEMVVRLSGQADKDLPARVFTMVPFQQQQLPSAALGWTAGGDIPTSNKDGQGLLTLEPFFRISAELDLQGTAVLNHGHSGQIKFKLQSEPLLQQLVRKVRQFLQKRYQI